MQERIMFHTSTTTYQTRMPFEPLAATAAVDVRADEHVAVRDDRQRELAVDDALEASFPASDPPAWNPGVARPVPVETPRHPLMRP
jgi:hypothetical protein